MNSFLSWLGGKSLLAKSIIGLFPEHRTYVEVFGGAGWVLFKKEPSKVEVYNDVNGDLVNLFRVVKHRPAEFAERLNLVLYSRETYCEFCKGLGDPLEGELERAVRFFYLVKAGFGSKVGVGWGFGKTRKPKLLYDPEYIQTVADRLRQVFVENKSFEFLLKHYDTAETLFYLDPPYTVTKGKYYQHDFGDEDHEKLREALGKVKGKWVLSYDDDPVVRELYKGYQVIETESIRYTLNNKSGAKGKKKNEIIVKNF